ncbi:MAG: DNA-directed RNA polymerase subunit omega [Lachnospiraceae bacterium]|nr:DNA-directed RNA polymerase subunit omega [Lachnospiraceae bacterium]
MLHPSYTEIMEKVNEEVEQGNEPVVNSRYSIVIAAAKRARQLIEAEKNEEYTSIQKPLSKAVEEIYNGDVKILSEEEVAAMEEESYEEAVEEIFASEEDEEEAAEESTEE